jgi:hypothetical protein
MADNPIQNSENQINIQLRIGFEAPFSDVRFNFSLAGLYFYLLPGESQFNTATQYLQSLGIEFIVIEDQSFKIHVKYLPSLKLFPERVEIVPSEDSLPLYELSRFPPKEGIPVTITIIQNNLQIHWFDGVFNRNHLLQNSLCAALLESEIPFVASEEAWEHISKFSRLPISVGKAKLNYDGFLEIVTSKPQLVEASPLKGLFKIDDSRFGMPIYYIDSLLKSTGYSYDHALERYQKPDLSDYSIDFNDSIEYSSALKDEISKVIPVLIENKSLAICRPSGAGRRILTLSLLYKINALPILIICPPSSVWVWQRHCSLLGLSHSVARDDSDVTIVTYRDFSAGAKIPRMQSIIFDDLSGSEATSAIKYLKRFDAFQDIYRVSVDSSWPDDPVNQLTHLSIIKPTEFSLDYPLSFRYSSFERFNEHANIYVSRNDNAFLSSPLYRRSSVKTLNLTKSQTDSIKQVTLQDNIDPVAALLNLIEITTSGSPQSISPKILTASEDAKKYLKRGDSVAILCRSNRTAMLLRSLLRPLNVKIHEGPNPEPVAGQAQVIYFSTEIPPIHDFDIVLVLDYPWNTSMLDSAVGDASAENGPKLTRIYHIVESIDDRLSLLAARRRELGYLGNSDKPSNEEVSFLLAPRWNE